MANIIKGDDLMLFDAQGHSIAFATAHTLSITADETNINSKDHGKWGATEISKINWEITSENLYTTAAYNSLFDKMIARGVIEVFFGLKQETGDGTVADGDYPYWTKKSTGGYYKGKAYITSLTANANSGENSTFSITLKGTGKLERVETGSTSGGGNPDE